MAMNDVFECLSKWMSYLCNSRASLTVESLSTGHAFADVLHVIDPSYFDKSWRDAVNSLADEDSYSGVKTFALRKILKAVLTYSTEVCNQPFSAVNVPDIDAIGRRNNALPELVKFMQLIVASAVHGPKGGDMIKVILTMEESIQQTIMLSIKELETNSIDYSAAASENEKQTVLNRPNSALSSDENMTTRCAKLEAELSDCVLQKQLLEGEIVSLKSQLESRRDAFQDLQKEMTNRLQQLQNTHQSLQMELEKSENGRDLLSAEVEKLKKEMRTLQVRGSSEADDESRKNKDEMDELRVKAMEAEKLSLLVEQLKNKLENMDDMKAQIKLLEEQNANLVAQNIQSEEEQRKSLSRKVKLDSLQMKLNNAESRASEQTNKVTHLELELKKILDRETATAEERDRLRQEKCTLQDTIDDLQCRLLEQTNASQSLPSVGCENADWDTVMTLAADAPVEVKQKLMQLYQENRQLRNRLSTDKENKSDSDWDLQIGKNETADDRSDAVDVSSCRSQIECLKKELKEKNDQLEKCVSDKREMLEKARQIILALNPVVKCQGDDTYTVCDIEAMKASLTEKESMIEMLQEEMDRMKIMYEQEQRLITTAFHELAWQVHRRAGEERLSSLLGEEPETFLSRQRQITMTKARSASSHSPMRFH